MVYAGMAVGRGRALKEYELGLPLTAVYTLMEDVVLLPFCQNLIVCCHQVHALVLGELFCHIFFLLVLLFPHSGGLSKALYPNIVQRYKISSNPPKFRKQIR